MAFAPLGGGSLDHGDVSDGLAGVAWSCQALPRSQEGVLAHVRPPQPSDPTRVPTSGVRQANAADQPARRGQITAACPHIRPAPPESSRSEEHTSELQSRPHLVCRLLLEKKKKQK